MLKGKTVKAAKFEGKTGEAAFKKITSQEALGRKFLNSCEVGETLPV